MYLFGMLRTMREEWRSLPERASLMLSARLGEKSIAPSLSGIAKALLDEGAHRQVPSSSRKCIMFACDGEL